ncbi:MAG: hypothetical protein HYX32_15590 [Actinobacteria bacterium]|nr:hypothetical protein [Actinomycetota bacterium]
MSGSDGHDRLVAQLVDRIDRLERELLRLEERDDHAVDAHRSRPAGQTEQLTSDQPVDGGRAAGPPAVPNGRVDVPVARRALLGRAGALAAGAVVAGTAATVLDASPAEAAAGTFDTNTAGTYAVSATVNSGVAADGVRVAPGAAGTGVNVIGGSTAPAVLASAAPSLFVSPTARGAVTGVNTASGAGAGVVGRGLDGTFGWGVVGVGNYVGVGADGPTWDLRLVLSSTIGFANPPPGTEHGPTGAAPSNAAGDLAKDANGDLWFCTAPGSAATATFRKVSGPGVAGSLHLLSAPKRVYDSRLGGQTPLNNSERSINVTTVGPGLPGAGASSGVPIDAVAILVNLTATDTVNAGWLAIWRNGILWPGHSNLNWSATGNNVANECSSAVAAGVARVKAASQANIILDIIGYYR